MIKIIALSYLPKLTRNFHEYYPLYRWSKQLNISGMHISIIYNLNDALTNYGDIIIIPDRYFAGIPETIVIENILSLRSKYTKIIFFDTSDTSGIDTLGILPYVDTFLKKQIFIDKDKYTKNEFDRSVRVWLPETPDMPIKYPNYKPCQADQLEKIICGWNIGSCDYRFFKGYLGLIRNYIYGDTHFTNVEIYRKYNLSFRGNITLDENLIYLQRNEILKTLAYLKINNILLGDKVSNKQYLQELKESKISISPFGWGEICYRDFESIISGCILLKPDMSHIETWPNVYIKDETYLSINWDLKNLESTLSTVIKNYNDYIPLAKHAQAIYSESINSEVSFINRFKSIVQY